MKVAFVRRKKMHGKHYYQLVRNYRQEGRHRQEVLCHLGIHDSIDGAIEDTKQRVLFYQEIIAAKQREAARLKARWQEIHDGEVEFYDEEEAREELAWMRWRNPYRSSVYPYAGRRGHGGEERWKHDRDEWEAEKGMYELCVGYYDALKDAELNKISANRSRARLNKLLECKRKYFP